MGPRGRQPEAAALAAVRAALGDLPLRRDLLIEHLHAVQDAHGALRETHLVALAALLRLAPVEVFEVASFYAHFHILPDDAPLPPPSLPVCTGIACALAGSAGLAGRLQAGGRAVHAAPCMGACHEAPAAGHPAAPPVPAAPADAFATLRGFTTGSIGLTDLLARLQAAGLRGMGGAGFPAWRKWRLVLDQPGPRHLVVNADEGEPGTFKDGHLLATEPHRVIEGMLLAAAAIGAEACWFYLRDEYSHLRGHVQAGLAAAGPLPCPVHLRRGAGAYICGEETALLESLEGKRGLPRHKPPLPGIAGLFGRPTLIHNVETLWWLPELLASDAAAAGYAAAGRHGRSGQRLLSLSGRIARPGVYLAPAGITARELIEEYGGGMAPGHAFAAYLPGGASGGMLPASLADLPLEFGALEAQGCFTGSGAVVVLSDHDDLPDAVRNLLRFFRDESCGQCTPCRVGTAKAAQLLEASQWDQPLLRELAAAMADGSICGLGQAAMNPVLSLLRHFAQAVP